MNAGKIYSNDDDRCRLIRDIIATLIKMRYEQSDFNESEFVQRYSYLQPELGIEISKLDVIFRAARKAKEPSESLPTTTRTDKQVFHANQQIEHFTLIECLGAGSFGQVWKAHDHD